MRVEGCLHGAIQWGVGVGVRGILIETYNTKHRDHRARLHRQTRSSIIALWRGRESRVRKGCNRIMNWEQMYCLVH